MEAFPVRRMPFEFPADVDLVFVEDDPLTSYTFLGAWMMLPYLEPYLIRSIQAATPQVKSLALREEMKRFCMQEGQHFRQHARANAVIRNRKPAYAKLLELEAQLEAEFKSFSETKSLKFNLAYAEGFEAMTSAMAPVQIELGIFDRPNALAQLALWHVTEEVEHRCVAFDAYDAVGGGYFYKLVVGLWAQIHYLGWAAKLAKVLRDADPEVFTRYDTPEIKARVKARRKAYWTQALPRWLAIYAPWYSPRKIRLPTNFEETQARFTAAATSVA